MLSVFVTWKQFFLCLIVIVGVYYTVALFLLFRKELQYVVRKKPRSLQPFLSAKVDSYSGKQPAPDAILYNMVLELMEDCKEVFQAALQQSLIKEQVIAALQARVQQYPQLRGAGFQVAVTNHIVQEMDLRLGMVLSDEDKAMIWC